jgi:hypothetical protein
MAGALGRSLGQATNDAAATLGITTGAVANVGERIVVEVGYFSGSTTITGVTDSAGNTYAIDLQNLSNNMAVAICSAHVTTQLASSGTITIAFSDTGANWQAAHAQAYTGLASSAAVDTTDPQPFSDQNWATAATAAAAAGAVIVGCAAMRDSTSRTHTPGTNMTTATTKTQSGNNNFASVYRELASAASFNALGAFSGTDFQNSNSGHVIYKGAVAGASQRFMWMP